MLEEYTLTVSLLNNDTRKNRLQTLHLAVCSLSYVWERDASGTFIHFRSGMDRTLVAARIKAAIDSETDTMLLGILGHCPEIMRMALNDNDAEPVDDLSGPLHEGRRSKPHRTPHREP